MFSEDIKVLLVKRKTSMSKLSLLIGSSVQNLSQKMKRNYLRDEDLLLIGDALNVDIEIVYKDRTTGNVLYQNKL